MFKNKNFAEIVPFSLLRSGTTAARSAPPAPFLSEGQSFRDLSKTMRKVFPPPALSAPFLPFQKVSPSADFTGPADRYRHAGKPCAPPPAPLQILSSSFGEVSPSRGQRSCGKTSLLPFRFQSFRDISKSMRKVLLSPGCSTLRFTSGKNEEVAGSMPRL